MRKLEVIREVGEVVLIAESISVTVTGIEGGQVRLGSDAPEEVPIARVSHGG